MKLGAYWTLNENFRIVDESDEGAPLLVVEFHNEWAKVPLEEKRTFLKILGVAFADPAEKLREFSATQE